MKKKWERRQKAAAPVLGGRGSSARKRRKKGSKRGAQAGSGAGRAAKRKKRADGREQPRTWEESRARLEAYRDAHRAETATCLTGGRTTRSWGGG